MDYVYVLYKKYDFSVSYIVGVFKSLEDAKFYLKTHFLDKNDYLIDCVKMIKDKI